MDEPGRQGSGILRIPAPPAAPGALGPDGPENQRSCREDRMAEDDRGVDDAVGFDAASSIQRETGSGAAPWRSSRSAWIAAAVRSERTAASAKAAPGFMRVP